MEVPEVVLSWLSNAFRKNAPPSLWLGGQTPFPTYRKRLQLPFHVQMTAPQPALAATEGL